MRSSKTRDEADVRPISGLSGRETPVRSGVLFVAIGGDVSSLVRRALRSQLRPNLGRALSAAEQPERLCDPSPALNVRLGRPFDDFFGLRVPAMGEAVTVSGTERGTAPPALECCGSDVSRASTAEHDRILTRRLSGDHDVSDFFGAPRAPREGVL